MTQRHDSTTFVHVTWLSDITQLHSFMWHASTQMSRSQIHDSWGMTQWHDSVTSIHVTNSTQIACYVIKPDSWRIHTSDMTSNIHTESIHVTWLTSDIHTESIHVTWLTGDIHTESCHMSRKLDPWLVHTCDMTSNFDTHNMTPHRLPSMFWSQIHDSFIHRTWLSDTTY